MKGPLTQVELRALRWAVRSAAEWRGSLTGDPDPSALQAHDRNVQLAKAGLKKLNGVGPILK